MKKRVFFKIFIPLLIVIFAAIYSLNNQFAPSTAFAVGDLVVDWGIAGIGDVGPIFNVTNWLPGDSETRIVNIDNGASSSRAIAIKGVKTSGIGDLEEVLDIIISETGGADLYGGTTGAKTVKDFFDDSTGPLGIFLFNLPGGANKDIDIKVKFQDSAGNEYQLTNVVFNIIIGITIEIPGECGDIEIDNVIFGTDGNDNIHGGAGSQLIIGFEGNDKLDGGAGRDCIIGNEGNDKIDGGAGGDVIAGGEGNNKIDGGAGVDMISSGSGNDNIKGGAGSDHILAGGGNDTVDGGAGSDIIDGQGGDDTLKGGAGADNLIGGPGTDSANGETGSDTCSAEVEISCEL